MVTDFKSVVYTVPPLELVEVSIRIELISQLYESRASPFTLRDRKDNVGIPVSSQS